MYIYTFLARFLKGKKHQRKANSLTWKKECSF